MAPTAAAAAPSVTHAGEGEETWFQPNRMELKATAETTGGAYGLVESWIPAGASPPLHVHRNEDEAFYVLEGRVRFESAGQVIAAGPGSFVFLPRDIPHTFFVESDGAHMLTLLSPGGGERFFVEGGRTPEGPGLPPPGPPDVALLRELAPRYGNEILGPPLTS